MTGANPIPRLVIAGAASSVGKTTVAVGLIAALRARGLRVAAFKCGPDYLDPTYHHRAAGVPCHNLDGWMMGKEAVLATFLRAAQGADIAIVEGVMGLFDGASPTSEEGSTAEIAKWLQAPVLLVVDTRGMARTVAAIAQGFAGFDRALSLQGLVCNRVGSRGHLELLRRTAVAPPIVGGLPIEPRYAFPERHLGLHTADRQTVPDAILGAWGPIVEEWLDLPAILEMARTAAPLAEVQSPPSPAASLSVPGPRIGLAFDEAFHFYYEDNLARLEALGAELVRFSPVHDRRLPEVDGLYLGGGYPETVAAELAGNQGMIRDVRAFAERGGPMYAECGGLMYLAREIRTRDDARHAMVGLIGGDVVVHDKLQALGYVEVETRAPTILGPAGLRLRGHQFRYSELTALADDGDRRYVVRRRRDGAVHDEGYAMRNVLASYVHVHWASNPDAAKGFVDSCIRYRSCSVVGWAPPTGNAAGLVGSAHPTRTSEPLKE
jgi:cobyrinic acid a,c-diamide synthase